MRVKRSRVLTIQHSTSNIQHSSSPETWTDADLVEPHKAADKAGRVRRMFAAIAPSYDLNNRLHSLGRDQAWRRAAVRVAEVQRDDVVLDVACGTGDLTLAFARAASIRPRRVIGIDFTPPMLRIAQRKSHAAANRRRHTTAASATDVPPLPHYQAGDAARLPVADNTCNIVSIAFGLRNIADPMQALDEFHRVLRPGGRLVILEFSLPTQPLLRKAYHFYANRVMPRTASWIARDRTGAYRYLPRSVETFVNREAVVKQMEAAGFGQVRVHPQTCGVALCYRGVRR